MNLITAVATYRDTDNTVNIAREISLGTEADCSRIRALLFLFVIVWVGLSVRM